MRWITFGLSAVFLAAAGESFGQTEDKEPSAILEIGGTAGQSLSDGKASFGPNLAVEVTPIEHWLEIEAGISPLLNGGRTEVDTDVVFKKPFTLSDTAELMIGAGPEWVHTNGRRGSANSIAGEAVFDFMFWPWPGRNYGWYLEPSYDYNFGGGHEQSLGASVGLLISIP